MATQLTALTASLQGDRMMSGAALIGKSVVVPGNAFELKAGQPVQASIDLPNGAQGLQIDVLNGSGQAVYQQILGPQQAGSLQFSWEGQDINGQSQPDGAYRFRVTAVAQGKNLSPTVSTLSAIRSVSQDASGEMLVQVQGGQTLKLADVKRIGG
jgi:flagellar basal-body rod modification protein FlgD